MESNKRALMILQLLVFTALVIFMLEKKFLIYEVRGATLSHYESVAGTDKVILLVEDFEGLSQKGSASVSDSLLKASGFFSYGSAAITLDEKIVDKNPLAAQSALRLSWKGTDPYGGWGKGVGANIELDPLTDYVNFRMYAPIGSYPEEKIKVMLQEDDDDNGILDERIDDKWVSTLTIPCKDQWQLISIPLKDFVHEGDGGDKVFNVTRKGGLHNIIFNLEQPDKYQKDQVWYFDFICFSEKKMEDNLGLK